MNNNYSSCKKRNKALIGTIEEIKSNFISNEEMTQELKRYKRNFIYIVDYNFAQYGNLLAFYSDVHNFLLECGYCCEHWSVNKLWCFYLLLVREAINIILEGR